MRAGAAEERAEQLGEVIHRCACLARVEQFGEEGDGEAVAVRRGRHPCPGHRAAEAHLQSTENDPFVGVEVGAVAEPGHGDEPSP